MTILLFLVPLALLLGLIALIAFAPFLVSSAVLFSGAEVCLAIARRTRTRIATLLDEE